MSSRTWSRARTLPLAGGRLIARRLKVGSRVPPASPRRVLVAHHLLLGDTIMLSPLLAKCRESWPSAELVMTCPVPYAGLYATRPYGVRAVPYDPRDATTLSALQVAAGFDLALVPSDNRFSWLACALDSRWIVAFGGDSPRYKDWPVDELRPYPEVPTAWGDLVAGLVDGPPPARYRVEDWPAPPAEAFEMPRGPYSVLHPGASTPLKQWPADRWRVLGERVEASGQRVVLTTGPGEEHLLDAIDPLRAWVRYPGTLSLSQLWQLLAKATLLVCPDTGIAHLARLIGVPTVALFGPGSALLSGAGDFWRDSAFTALTIPDFPCRDQTITMKREVAWVRRCERLYGTAAGQCPEARCMLALSGDMVWHALAEQLGVAVD
jgi:ADP-heptose:LPS heptosyltransferase